MIQCRKCISTPNTPVECIGQTERALRDKFGEHRRAIQNNTDDAIPQHFFQPENQLTDIELIPLELIITKPNIFTLKRYKLCSHRTTVESLIYLFISFIIIHFILLFIIIIIIIIIIIVIIIMLFYFSS